MSAFSIILTTHSIVRWFVVFAALIALGVAFAGWFGRRAWTASAASSGLFFTSFLDMQVLLGLILFFFLSPITTAWFHNFSAAASSPATEYFTFEHALPMLAAMAFAHIGRSRSQKAATDTARYRQATIFYSLAVIALLFAIPWPFYPFGRPLV